MAGDLPGFWMVLVILFVFGSIVLLAWHALRRK